MDKPKSNKIKWIVLVIGTAIIGVAGVWVAINFNGLWKNVTFDKEDNIAAYEKTKAEETDKDINNRLEIPSLNVVANLFYPSNTKDMYGGFGDGVGHMPNTAMPGEIGNTVFFGHSSGRGGSYYETIFATLHRLDAGDEIYIYKENKLYKYAVTSEKIIDSNDFSILGQEKDKKLTLVTCWPIGTNWQRYVVFAEQIEESDRVVE